ncbi:hypothetical protein HYU19_00145 [Candidatus Woesearchaeota archaeon]|nr:hypothetical protein [Candidatus Woesearchaeota archaeon]
MVKKIKKKKPWRPIERAAAAGAKLDAKSRELHQLIDGLDDSDMGIPPPDMKRSDQEIAFAMTQNLFRRVYHGLRDEPIEVQHDLLSKMKAAAVDLMAYGDQFQSTADVSNPSIKASTDVLYRYARQRGLWDEKVVEDVLHSDSRSNFLQFTPKRFAAHITGDELLDLWNDMERQHEMLHQDYRQRLSPLLYANPVKDPLVVGVMTYGLYFAAIFYQAVQRDGKQPELALVKKSRQDRQMHVFPTEEGLIRKAISAGRDIVVVDDLIHDFKGLFAIYDYFGKPPTMRFSAGFYTSPLPRELDVMERPLFEHLLLKPEKIRFADPLAQHSLTSILQYGMGIDRQERDVILMPPVVNIE